MAHVRQSRRDHSLTKKPPRGWLLIVAWMVVAGAFLWNIRRWVMGAVPLGRPWQEPGLYLLDFRDLIMVPGRFLLGGGNPYDPRVYLAANPWAQEFDPYAPSWLWLSASLAWMPLEVAASVYLALMSLVLIGLSLVVSRLIWPRHWYVAVPFVSLWLLLWYPTRYLGSSFIVSLGFALVFLALGCRGYEAAGVAGRVLQSPWLPAFGISVAMVKPQFGVPLVVFLAALTAWGWIWRGFLILTLTSLPPLILCVVNAGGISQFLSGVSAVIEHASSPAAPTGLGSPHMFRTDLQGLWYRIFGWDPGLGGYAVCIALVLLTMVVVRRASSELLPCLIGPVVLTLPIHLDYDYVLMLWAAVGAALFFKKYRTGIALSLLLVSSVPLLQIYAIQRVFGISPLLIDILAFCSAIATWVIAVIVTLRQEQRRPASVTQELKGEV